MTTTSSLSPVSSSSVNASLKLLALSVDELSSGFLFPECQNSIISSYRIASQTATATLNMPSTISGVTVSIIEKTVLFPTRSDSMPHALSLDLLHSRYLKKFTLIPTSKWLLSGGLRFAAGSGPCYDSTSTVVLRLSSICANSLA